MGDLAGQQPPTAEGMLSVPSTKNNLLYTVLCMACSGSQKEDAAPCMCLHKLAACPHCLPFVLLHKRLALIFAAPKAAHMHCMMQNS